MRDVLKIALAVCIGASILAGCNDSPPATVGVAPPESRRVEVAEARALLTSLAAQAVGFSIAVAEGGRVVWSEAYGYSDLEAGTPATPDTRFRLYSVAKPITASAAARLMEMGRLDVDAPVQRYVSYFPEKVAPITLMQLATHSSGIRHYADDDEAANERHCENVRDALQIFADDPLVHAPGEGETYSSWGYVLLSEAIAGAAGRTYEQAMDELVFAPIGASSFVIDDPTIDVVDRSKFYEEVAPGSFAVAADVDNTCKWGAGAWLGTAGDVATFGLALVDEGFLSEPTQQLFLQGEPAYRAQGLGTGGSAFLIVDAARDLSVVLLSNAIGETVGPALQETADRLYDIFQGD